MGLERESWVFGQDLEKEKVGFSTMGLERERERERERKLGFQPRLKERALTFSHLQLAHRDRELKSFPFGLGDFCKERELGNYELGDC